MEVFPAQYVGVAGKSVKLRIPSLVKKRVLKTWEMHHKMRRPLHATFVLNLSVKQVENKPWPTTLGNCVLSQVPQTTEHLTLTASRRRLFTLLSVWSAPTKIPGTGNMIYLQLNASKCHWAWKWLAGGWILRGNIMHASPFRQGFPWHQLLVTVEGKTQGYTDYLFNLYNSFFVLCYVRLCLHGPLGSKWIFDPCSHQQGCHQCSLFFQG